MHEVVEIDFKNQKVWLSDGDQRDIASGVLMQSTWLEDKNGDEIFRGDIVIFEYYWPTYIWEVSSNEFFHSCIKVWEKEFHIDNAMIWEVIGNIYEKPALVNA